MKNEMGEEDIKKIKAWKYGHPLGLMYIFD